MFTAFMNLEKVYEKVDRKGLWDVLKIYSMGGLIKGITQLNRRGCWGGCEKRVHDTTVDPILKKRGTEHSWVLNPSTDDSTVGRK